MRKRLIEVGSVIVQMLVGGLLWIASRVGLILWSFMMLTIVLPIGYYVITGKDPLEVPRILEIINPLSDEYR